MGGGINIPEKIELPECVDNAVKNLTDEPTKQLGTTISDLLNLSFGWISYLSEKQKIKMSYGLNEFKKSLEAKANAIPIEHRIDPDIQTAGQALENAKYCLDKEELMEMFANLIASSFDATKCEKTLPMFSMIIKQLTPYDAKVLSEFASNNNTHVFPICKYGARNQQGIVYLQTNIFIEGLANANKEEIDKRSAAISCLETLGLVKTNYWDALVTPGLYEKFEKIEAYADYAIQAIYLGGCRHIEITRGNVALTPIGKQFVEICLPKQIT